LVAPLPATNFACCPKRHNRKLHGGYSAPTSDTMKFMIQAGGILGALAVALGAFGAHALKGMLETSGRMETFETAVKYQFYHALAMVLVGILMQRAGADAAKWLGWSGNAFAIGVIIFSGSLYAICFTGITKFGATAPIGGLLLIAGWILLIMAAGRVNG
jgi:uncharacterized membrane protein YgdD (TMEM256/DUF423 family)